MEDASCLFIGGAEHPDKFERGTVTWERQSRMLNSVQHDFLTMIEFASTFSARTRLGATRQPSQQPQYRHSMSITNMLINESISQNFSDSIIKKVSTNAKKHDLVMQAEEPFTAYSSKEEVRHAVRSFLQNSPTQHLLLFMSGHGEQTKNPGEVVEESFLLPGRFEQEYYTDADFTEDIEKMPNGKKLYIVVHSCHSGGMLNTWDMAKHKWVVVFASAEADILAEWNSDEDSPSFVKSFCKYAKPGTRLCEIGDGIWQEQADVKKRIRPAFLPMRPEMASARFLSAM